MLFYVPVRAILTLAIIGALRARAAVASYGRRAGILQLGVLGIVALIGYRRSVHG